MTTTTNYTTARYLTGGLSVGAYVLATGDDLSAILTSELGATYMEDHGIDSAVTAYADGEITETDLRDVLRTAYGREISSHVSHALECYVSALQWQHEDQAERRAEDLHQWQIRH